MQNNNSNVKTFGAVAITAMLFIGVYIFIINNQPPKVASVSDTTAAAVTAKTTPATTDTSADNTTADTTNITTTYKNGTYAATGSYLVPEGDVNSITVTLTVKDDTLTAVSTTNSYSNRESREYVEAFKNGISGVVVGKKLDNAKVGRVNGSSLTGNGFNSALSAIIQKAKA